MSGIIDRSHPSQPVRKHAGTQSTSNASQTSVDIEPQNSGSVTESYCYITVQNTGSEDFWVNGGTDAAQGVKLKPGEDGVYANHTSTDGDLQIYPDTANGHTAEMEFLE